MFQVESTAVADFDGDGFEDILALHIDRRTRQRDGWSSLRLYRNDRSGSLVDETTAWIPPGLQDNESGFFELQAADINGDARPDVVFTMGRGGGGPGTTTSASLVLLVNRGDHFEQVELPVTQWQEPLAAPDQWMPGSPVLYTVNDRPTFLISKAGRVYSVRFSAL